MMKEKKDIATVRETRDRMINMMDAFLDDMEIVNELLKVSSDLIEKWKKRRLWLYERKD